MLRLARILESLGELSQIVHQRVIGKVRQPKQIKSTQLRYMINASKNKTKFCHILLHGLGPRQKGRRCIIGIIFIE